MNADLLNLAPAAPEIFLLIAVSLILIIDLFSNDPRRSLTHNLTLLSLGVAFAMTAGMLGEETSVYAFSNMFVSDPMSNTLKLFSYIAVAATLIYARAYARDREMLRGELYTLSMFALLGQMVMISANSFLVIYLGLELLSLSLYALVALRRDSAVATEAAMKYFVLGALASGFLLYGMSMLYGATGTLDLPEVAASIADGQAKQKLVLVFGLVFIVAGLAFKLGAVPFHMWVPDVYQGSPTAVTLLIGGAPKLAAFAMTLRLLVEGLGAVAVDWQQMLVIMAVLSLAIGNITAIAQTNIKRMLAYSTISHMGFVLLGLLSGVTGGSVMGAPEAYGSAMFYVVTYVLTTLASFGVLMLLSREGFECENVADLKGLNRRSPWFALVMLLVMFSLAGIPPTVGFYAKLAVLNGVVNAGMVPLAVIAVMMSLVGAFYYLRIVKTMYFEEPADVAPIEPMNDMRVILSVNGALIVGLGLLPGPLMALCANAVRLALAS